MNNRVGVSRAKNWVKTLLRACYCDEWGVKQRVWLATASLFAVLILFGQAQATTLTGSIKRPDGTGVTGQLRIKLSQQAAQLSTGGCGGPAILVPNVEVSFAVTNGTLASSTIVGTDCLTPTGVYYVVRTIDNNGNVLATDNWCSITGASVDVGTIASCAVPSGTFSFGTVTTTNLLAGSATITTMAGNPTFSGTPIFGAATINGAWSFPGAGVTFRGSTSGTTILKASAVAGATTLTMPAVTSTFTTFLDKLSVFAATTSAELAGVLSDESGSSGTFTRTGAKLDVFAATTSGELATVISDETGSGGGFVRATGPTISGAQLTGTQRVTLTEFTETTASLANGLNSDIAITSTFVVITGPTGAFSVGGFGHTSLGTLLYLYNSVGQQMTIVNQDGASTATNRIATLTGANVVLRTGTSFATFIYDATQAGRWILVATN